MRVSERERENMISDSLIIHTKWQWIIIGLCLCVYVCRSERVRYIYRAVEVFVIHSWYMDGWMDRWIYIIRIVLEIKRSTSFIFSVIRHEIAFSLFRPTQGTSIKSSTIAITILYTLIKLLAFIAFVWSVFFASNIVI